MSYFTVENAQNINLLLPQNLALHFALSGALCSASFPEHHGLYFHYIITTLVLFARQGCCTAHFPEMLRDLPKCP